MYCTKRDETALWMPFGFMNFFFLNSLLFGFDGKPEGKGNLEDPGVDGRIILNF